MARDYSCRSENDHYPIYGTKKWWLPLSLALNYVHTGGNRKDNLHESSISH